MVALHTLEPIIYPPVLLVLRVVVDSKQGDEKYESRKLDEDVNSSTCLVG